MTYATHISETIRAIHEIYMFLESAIIVVCANAFGLYTLCLMYMWYGVESGYPSKNTDFRPKKWF